MEKEICCSSDLPGALNTLAVVSKVIPATYHTSLYLCWEEALASST